MAAVRACDLPSNALLAVYARMEGCYTDCYSTELAAELDAGIWHMVPATTDAVFSAAADMWPRLVRRATSSSMARWVGISDLVGAGDLN